MSNEIFDALDKAGAVAPHAGARIMKADLLDVMALLPTGCIDLATPDPPYFLSNGGSTNSGGKRVVVDKGGWDTSEGVRADYEYNRRWLRALQRVLNPAGTAFISGTQHNIFSCGMALKSMGWRILNTITWEKPNPPPNQGCRCFTHSTEFIIWASPNNHEPQLHVFNYDDAKAITGKQMKDVWRIGAPTTAEKKLGKHPAQKPIELLRQMIALASNPGAIVFDPFMGSGTAGVAARAMGRLFVGCDTSDKHFDLAHRRLSEFRILPVDNGAESAIV